MALDVLLIVVYLVEILAVLLPQEWGQENRVKAVTVNAKDAMEDALILVAPALDVPQTAALLVKDYVMILVKLVVKQVLELLLLYVQTIPVKLGAILLAQLHVEKLVALLVQQIAMMAVKAVVILTELR